MLIKFTRNVKMGVITSIPEDRIRIEMSLTSWTHGGIIN